MRVLIGTDGSPDAISAAARAVELLAHADVVTLVYVGETPALASAGLESGFAGGVARPEEVDAAWDAVRSLGEAALERTAAALSGAEVETRVEMGAPGPDLCRLAEELSADVVAVGSRGQGAIRRALMGSVSTHVVNNAPCAVMVLRSGTD